MKKLLLLCTIALLSMQRIVARQCDCSDVGKAGIIDCDGESSVEIKNKTFEIPGTANLCGKKSGMTSGNFYTHEKGHCWFTKNTKCQNNL